MDKFRDFIQKIGITDADTTRDALEKLADCRESRKEIIRRWRHTTDLALKSKQKQYNEKLKAINKKLVEQLRTSRHYFRHSRNAEDQAWLIAADDIEKLQITNAILGEKLTAIEIQHATDIEEVSLLKNQIQVLKSQQKSMLAGQKSLLRAMRESYTENLKSKHARWSSSISAQRGNLKDKLLSVKEAESSTEKRANLQVKILKSEIIAKVLAREKQIMLAMQEMQRRYAKMHQKVQKHVKRYEGVIAKVGQISDLAHQSENNSQSLAREQNEASGLRLVKIADLERIEAEKDHLLGIKGCMESKLRYAEAECKMLEQKFNSQASFSQKIMFASYKKAARDAQSKKALLAIISRGVAMVESIRQLFYEQRGKSEMVKEKTIYCLSGKLQEQNCLVSCVQAENARLHQLIYKIEIERGAKQLLHAKLLERMSKHRSNHASLIKLLDEQRKQKQDTLAKTTRHRQTRQQRRLERSLKVKKLKLGLLVVQKTLALHGQNLAHLSNTKQRFSLVRNEIGFLRESLATNAVKLSELSEMSTQRKAVLLSQISSLQMEKRSGQQTIKHLQEILVKMDAEIQKLNVIRCKQIDLLTLKYKKHMQRRDTDLEEAQRRADEFSIEITKAKELLKREEEKFKVLAHEILPKLVKYSHTQVLHFRAICACYNQRRAKADTLELESRIAAEQLRERIGEVTFENTKLKEEESKLLTSNSHLIEKHASFIHSCRLHHDALQKTVRQSQARRTSHQEERTYPKEIELLIEYCKEVNGKLSDTEAELIQAYNFIQIKLRQDQLQNLPTDVRPKAVKDCLEAELSWLKRLSGSPKLHSSDADSFSESDLGKRAQQGGPAQVFSSDDEVRFEIDTKPSKTKPPPAKNTEKDAKSKCMCIN